MRRAVLTIGRDWTIIASIGKRRRGRPRERERAVGGAARAKQLLFALAVPVHGSRFNDSGKPDLAGEIRLRRKVSNAGDSHIGKGGADSFEPSAGVASGEGRGSWRHDAGRVQELRIG